MSQRMVTQDDLIKYPFLQSKGVSANQLYDFSTLEPIKKTISIPHKVYDISETRSFVPYEIVTPKNIPPPIDVKKQTIAEIKTEPINIPIPKVKEKTVSKKVEGKKSTGKPKR